MSGGAGRQIRGALTPGAATDTPASTMHVAAMPIHEALVVTDISARLPCVCGAE